MKKRVEYLDSIRGIAIIFVVMGHFIQYNINGLAADNCFNFIYSFHMGFFFFISGTTAALTYRNNSWSNFLPLVKKKFTQLIVPYIVWSTLLWGG